MYILAHAGIALGVLLLLVHYTGNKVQSYDIRLLLVGSMLPDIIDKPLNIAGISAGRGYGHTAVFCVAIVMLCARYNVPEISFGSAVHILLDAIWTVPRVFLWPLKGISLPTTPYDVAFYWERVMESEYVQVTEAIGLSIFIIIILRFRLYKIDRLRTIIMSGHIDEW